MHKIQRLAAETVCEVLAGHGLSAALAALWSRVRPEPSERGAIQDLSYGALRHYGPLSALVAILAARPPADPYLRCLLLVALYQLRFTLAKPYAVVDQAVDAAPLPAKGFVNALLRRFLREQHTVWTQATATDSGRFSHPQWWIDRVRTEYPATFTTILEAGNERPPLTLRVNRRRITPEAYFERLREQGIGAERIGPQAILLADPRPVAEIPGFAEGLCSVHDAGAQRAAHYLDVGDGLRVLDACAAPGGKASHILELARVELTALDADCRRLARVTENLARLGLAARLLCGDARKVATWWDGVAFDRVLLDAPCSASGVVRRHPDAKWLRRESDIAQFAELQQTLLDSVWQVLASDGKLLYVTCSVFKEENQLQSQFFLERHPDAYLVPLADPELVEGQLLPSARHDGFYYALFWKRSPGI
jgi:16S rRNA (cytosine967-C5)-methyltransferase